ncbi:uncharacterized protein LOC130014267 [Patella vulgata]|uniref:uncharacterized protein LOC130014267 n=1 Tax=Patella vulgata TaxID=6465 RepID=UPI0024A7F5CE|nr:uncharacterized protein LOC130014267 [Patella vulgata]
MDAFETYTHTQWGEILQITDEFEYWTASQTLAVNEALDHVENENHNETQGVKRQLSDPDTVDASEEEERLEKKPRPVVSPILFSDDDSDFDTSQICQVGRGGEDLVRLISVERRFSRKFNIHSELMRIEIINTEAVTTPDWLERLFTQILETVRENFNVQPNERVRIQLNHPDLDNPIYIAFRPYEELTLELILEEIAKVMQSKKTLVIDNQTSISVTYVASKEGGAFTNKVLLNEAFMSSKKRTFISPVANYGYQTCFGQSIVLGINEISYRKKISPTVEETKHYKRVANKRKKKPLQIAMAMEMYQEYGVNPLVPTGRPEWCIFQEHLKAKYQIVIYDAQSANCVIFRGVADPNVPVLRLYLMEKHFYYIKKINSLFNQAYYCPACEKPYSDKNKHMCVI